MRLLKTTDGYTYKLTKEFLGDDQVPPYAILSHTWKTNQEVTFEDLIKDNKIRSSRIHACLHRLRSRHLKTGYDKIRFCAQQAWRDGLHYFWVDTCCINKKDPIELQVAINSMFHWYQSAAKCYVYLSDVSTADGEGGRQPSAWHSAFAKSRWFTRGWTLQELLAPSEVEFFSKEGVCLGNRLELKHQIHDITNISLRALSGAPLVEFGVDERLSWAEGRSTTLKEDKVYALLGIFGISLPFIYGEEYENVLRRLLEEIANSQAVTIGQDRSTLPFQRDLDFINRDCLSIVHRMCAEPAARVALVGLGGAGKSQIAIEYACQVLQKSPQQWVFWVHSGTQARFKEGYRKIAEITNIANWNDPKADVVQLVTSWLCEESNGRWLMIIDNADDASVFFHNTASRAAYKSDTTIVEPPVSTFLPYTSHGSILITSRSREVACRLTRTEKSIVEVGPMDRQEAFALLQKKFTSPVYREEADALIDALGHMPLALTQAAAFINRTPRMSISQYLKDIEHSQAHLLKKNMVDIRRDAQASNSIMTTWQISFEHIRERSPAAARLLSLMCLFDQQAIPKKLLQGRYGGHENERSHFENDIYILTSFSFVKASADKSSFEMHSLVQYATKRWLEHSCELESWKGVYMALIDDKYPIGRPENWPVCQALYPHAQVALDDHPFSADALENWASISWKAAWYMGEMGDYEKAYKLALDSFDIRTILLGPDDPDTLDSLNTVGVALSRLRRYDEAKIMYQRAVEGKKRTLGAEHLDTLTSMLNLAIVYDSQGHWIDAERLLKQILEVASKKDWEAGRSLTLSTLTTLATTYRNLGRYTEAADSELQILEAREAQLGPDYPTTLTVKGNLAYTYRHLGRLKEAEELNLQVLSAHEQNHHAEIEILATKAHLASIYKEQGRWLEAETLQREVLDTTTTKLGPNHPDTLYAMGNLAGTYWTQGRFSEAEALQLQLLDLRRSILGDQHPSTLDTKASLAVTYWSQNRFSEAETLKLEVLHIRKEKLGDEHPLTLDSKTSLASTYREQGRLGDAEVLDTEVLNVRMEKLGAEHPSTLGSMGNLAVTLRRLGGVERAYELMGKCYEGHVRVLGVEHPLTAKYREGLEKWRRADEQKE